MNPLVFAAGDRSTPQITMAQNRQILKIFGGEVGLTSWHGEFGKIATWLSDDFGSCPHDGPLKSRKMTIEIVKDLPPQKGLLWFWRPGTWVYGWGSKKNYRTSRGIRMQIQFTPDRQVQIAGPNLEIIYETLYLLILSTIGEWFETDGWIRLHALSLESESGPLIFIAPQGFGKSLLAGLLVDRKSMVRPLGDEIALVKGREFLAFPLRLALAPQIALDFQIPTSGRRTYRQGQAHKSILSGKPSSQTSQRSPEVFFIRQIRESWHELPGLSVRSQFEILIGRGLPQMIEYLFRLDHLRDLTQTLINRMRWIQHSRRAETLTDLQAGPRTPEAIESFSKTFMLTGELNRP